VTFLGHFRQIDPLPTLSACPLRSDRVRTFAPQRLDAVCQEEISRPPSAHTGDRCSFIRELPAGRAEVPFLSGSADAVGRRAL